MYSERGAARLRTILAMGSPASSRSRKLAQIWRSTGPGLYSFRSNTCHATSRSRHCSTDAVVRSLCQAAGHARCGTAHPKTRAEHLPCLAQVKHLPCQTWILMAHQTLWSEVSVRQAMLQYCLPRDRLQNTAMPQIGFSSLFFCQPRLSDVFFHGFSFIFTVMPAMSGGFENWFVNISGHTLATPGPIQALCLSRHDMHSTCRASTHCITAHPETWARKPATLATLQCHQPGHNGQLLAIRC